MTHATFGKVFKAPKRKIFKINGIKWCTISSGANNIIVRNRHVEDGGVNLTPAAYADSNVFVANTNTATPTIMNYEDLECKYFHVGAAGVVSVAGVLIVDYEIKSASLTDLVWEWIGFGRGR